MSALVRKLRRLYDEGHGIELPDLRSDAWMAPETIRPAAVLVAITDRPAPGVILTHRPDGMRAHSGQVAFPGGKIDPGENAVEAAVREAQEELALNPRDITIIGSSDLFISGSGYEITPVLATIPPDLPLVANPAEVRDWFEAPLDHLLDPANHVQKKSPFQGALREYIEIDWQGNRIWGITAAILANLSRRLAWRGPSGNGGAHD